MARKDVLNDRNDTELIRKYCLDHAGILFVTSQMREALKREIGKSNPPTTKMKVIIAFRHLAAGKMQLCSSDGTGESLREPRVAQNYS